MKQGIICGCQENTAVKTCIAKKGNSMEETVFEVFKIFLLKR